MAIAGHTCDVLRTSDAVAMTTEACTLLSGNARAQVTNTAKRVLDPDTAISVVDNGGAVADSDFTVNYLFGVVTKNSGTWTGPVTITGAYLPTYLEYEPRSISIECSVELQDTTPLGTQDRCRGEVGLYSAEGDVVVLDDGRTADANSDSLQTDFEAGVRRVLTLDLGATEFRAFIRLEELSRTASVDGLFELTYRWKSTRPKGTDQAVASRCFGFSTNV